MTLRQPHTAWEVEAALLKEFVDAYESDSQRGCQSDSQSDGATTAASDDLEHSPCASPASATRAGIDSASPPSHALALSTKRRFTSTSVRRKHEMAALRREEATLRAQLAELQHDANASSTTNIPDTVAVAASRQTAQRNHAQLLRALRENAALRASATEHKRMAKMLRRILYNRASSLAIIERTLRVPLPPVESEHAFASDRTAVFARLVASLHDMGTRTNSVLGVLARDIPAVGGMYRKWHVQRNAETDTLELEVVHCHEVPFCKADVDCASRSMYREQRPNKSNLDPQDFGGAPTMRMLEASARYAAPSAAGVYRVRHANETFEAADRTLSLSVAYVDSADAAVPLPGIVLADESWTLLTERTRVDPLTGDSQSSTLIEVYSRITPVVASGMQPRFWDRAVVETELIPAWDELITFAHQTIENKLMDVVSNSRRRQSIGQV